MISKNSKSRQTRTTTGISEEKKWKEKWDIRMDVRRMLFNKSDAKKPFVTKASDNRASKSHVTGVYAPICSHTLWPHIQ